MTEFHSIEALFVSSNNSEQLACSVYDLHTGTNLINYKGGVGCIAAAQTLNVLNTEYVVVANASKPLLHVWPINGQEQLKSLRLVTPGVVTALAFSADGVYLVAGIQEVFYVWNVTTGRLLNSVSKHFQSITCLRFTDDGSHFISAGKDGVVMVWNLSQVISRSYDDRTDEALYNFNDHGLPVSDMHVGVGGLRAYLYTVSLDRTCKVYDLFKGTLLLNVIFSEGLMSITVNSLETSVYVGTNNGNIFVFHMDNIPRTKEFQAEEKSQAFIGQSLGTSVNCLALALDGQILISGSSYNKVLIWDTPSRQLIKTITQCGSITNLSVQLTHSTTFQPKRKQSERFCANLKRMKDPIEIDEEETIDVMVTTNTFEKSDCEIGETFFKTECNYVPNGNTATSTNTAARDEELQDLRKEVQRLRSINKELFLNFTNKILEQ